MEKLIFKINRGILTVSIINKEIVKEDLNNTNIVDTKEIVFSIDYIQKNPELVSSFLSVILLKRAITRITIKDEEIIALTLKLVNNMPMIEELYLKPNKPISYPIFILLLENKYLKKIDVYDIPPYLLERLDINNNLKINIRSEILFVSDFMTENKLNSYSDIYYTKTVDIHSDFNQNDYQDFMTFININHYLKKIIIHHYNPNVFEFLMDTLLEHQKQDIKIVLKEINNDVKAIYDAVNKQKKANEKYFRENGITFKLDYSQEFKYNNLFKQINLNFIKISTIAIIFLILLLMGINYYKNYSQTLDIKTIEAELQEIINTIDREYDFNIQDNDIEFIEPDDPNAPTSTTTTTKSNYVSSYYQNYEKVFDTLLKINNDTKGWITVNNTRIDYPVVQAKDNDYYLKRDFNKVKNSMGWIFMDYRNNIDSLDDNTIIYGHNISDGGIMFGTLRYTLNDSWYTKTPNQIISFNTLNAMMKWQIIAIYKIPNTSDYLAINFNNDEEHQNFINMIVGRSIYNFNQAVTTTDKILTLSTCQNRGQERLVIHAKLIID